MAINSLSVGRDMTINIHTPSGEINLDTVTSFRANSDTDNRTSVSINGNVLPVPLPMGVSGSFDLDRTSPALEEYWQSFEDQYYKGENILSSTITVTVNEANGSVSQYILTGIMFDNPTYGTWSGDNIVAQTISFRGSRIEKIV